LSNQHISQFEAPELGQIVAHKIWKFPGFLQKPGAEADNYFPRPSQNVGKRKKM
jgi:hypothetical protein